MQNLPTLTESKQHTNLFSYNMEVTREIRSRQKSQIPFTLWFTGLSGSGKSTIANEVEKRLVERQKHTMSLDGDNRQGLNNNLSFTEQDRIENIRRVAEVAKLMNDAGLIVLASFISPFANDRKHAREIIGKEHFLEIYISTPLEVCEKRDVKGLYKKARSGSIPNFTGISSPYEPPESPALSINTGSCTPEEAADMVLELLTEYLDG